MNFGFIGAGSMGSLLVRAFVEAGAMRSGDIAVSSRSPHKAEALALQYPGIRTVLSNAETARGSNLLFLCVKPSDYRSVLTEIAPVLQPGQIAVSITSTVKVEWLETLLPCKIAKIIPSVVNSVRSGASLFMWGTRMEPQDRALLLELFGAISRPVEIREDVVRAASDLTSCGPAFFASLLEQFAEAAVREAGIEPETARKLAAEMLLGTAKMLTEGDCSAKELQVKVTVPGGITAAALDTLRRETADAFPRVVSVTHRKFAEDLEKVSTSLFGPAIDRSL